MKTVGKALVGTILALTIGMAGGMALLRTSYGKRALCLVIERQASAALGAEVAIGSLNGNLWRRIELTSIELRSEKRVVARAARIDIEWQLAWPARFSPQVVVNRATIDRPDVSFQDLQELAGHRAPSQGVRSDRLLVWVRELRVSNGKVDEITPIDVEVVAPERWRLVGPELWRGLPKARFSAAGRWRGLAVDGAGSVWPVARASAGRLSAVAKSATSKSDGLALSGHWGPSTLSLTGEGLFDWSDPSASVGRIDLHELHVESPRGISAKGSLSAISSGALEASLRIDIEKHGAILLAGHGDAGSRRRLTIEKASLVGAGQHAPLLAMRRPTSLELRPGELAPRGHIEFEGRAGALSYDHTEYPIVARIRKLDIAAILNALSLLSGPPRMPLAKLITARLALPDGISAATSWDQTRWITQGELSGLDVGLFSGLTGLVSGRFSAAGTAQLFRAHVEAHAQGLGLSTALPAHFDATANFDFDGARATLNGSALSRDSDLRVSFTAAAEGQASRVLSDGSQALRSGTASFELDSGNRRGPPRLATHLATIEATYHGAKDPTLDAELNVSGASTDGLTAFLTDGAVLTTGGKLQGRLRASGPIARPSYEGALRLSADRLSVNALGTRYSKIALGLRGDDTHIVLETLSIGDSLKATGQLALGTSDAAKAVTLHAELKDFEAYATDALDIKTTGKLDLTANRDDSSFSGAFDVKNARVTIPDLKGGKDVEPTGDLEDVRTVSSDVSARRGSSRIHGMVALRAPGALLLVSADKSLNIELAADGKIGVDAGGDFAVQGSVKTIRGEADVFGRRFDLEPSEATFQSTPGNPRIDATAEYHAPVYGVIVTLKGELQTLKPKLSSDPPGLSEDQCLGVLLTGNPDFNSRGANGTNASAAAGNIASGLLLGQLKTKLGSSLPIDSLTADLGSQDVAAGQPASNDNAEGRKKVEVGKYVSDRIYVKVGHVFSSQDLSSMDRVLVDYRLSPRWSLETSQTDQGQSDLQLLWTLSY